jgi:hypothetical protein
MSSTGLKENYFDYAIFYNNTTCLSDFNISGLSVYNSLINGALTSTSIIGNLNSLSTYSNLNISNLQSTSTSLFTNLNSLSSATILNANNLNVSGTSKLMEYPQLYHH